MAARPAPKQSNSYLQPEKSPLLLCLPASAVWKCTTSILTPGHCFSGIWRLWPSPGLHCVVLWAPQGCNKGTSQLLGTPSRSDTSAGHSTPPPSPRGAEPQLMGSGRPAQPGENDLPWTEGQFGEEFELIAKTLILSPGIKPSRPHTAQPGPAHLPFSSCSSSGQRPAHTRQPPIARSRAPQHKDTRTRHRTATHSPRPGTAWHRTHQTAAALHTSSPELL